MRYDRIHIVIVEDEVFVEVHEIDDKTEGIIAKNDGDLKEMLIDIQI